MWHVTHDMWHMVGGKHSLKILAPQLLRFGIDSVLKVLNKRITQRINKLMNHKGVYRKKKLIFVCFYSNLSRNFLILYLGCAKGGFLLSLNAFCWNLFRLRFALTLLTGFCFNQNNWTTVHCTEALKNLPEEKKMWKLTLEKSVA